VDSLDTIRYVKAKPKEPKEESLPMEEHVRKLNAEYGFQLSEDEIKLVAAQAEAAERLFRPLHEIDLTHVMPLLKVDQRKVGK
jgi:hypothetical protein